MKPRFSGLLVLAGAFALALVGAFAGALVGMADRLSLSLIHCAVTLSFASSTGPAAASGRTYQNTPAYATPGCRACYCCWQWLSRIAAFICPRKAHGPALQCA